MLDDVYCVGTEKSIRQCKKRRWLKYNCNHHEDAGVRCHVPSLQGHEVGNIMLTKIIHLSVYVYHMYITVNEISFHVKR